MIKKIIKNKYLFVAIIASILLIIFKSLISKELYFHDCGNFGDFINYGKMGTGHFGLMEFLFKFNKLPDFDVREVYGFYNPPLYYIVCALVLKISTNFSIDSVFLISCVQYVNLVAVIICYIVFYYIIHKIIIKDRIRFLVFILFLLHPWNFYFSVQCTNDCFMFMFALLTVLFLIKWHETKSIKNILILALFFGFGMASKLSFAVMSVVVSFVFLYDSIVNIINSETSRINTFLKYLLEFVIFLIIASAIGLFYPIKNYIEYDVPFNFIQLWDGPSNPGLDYVKKLIHINFKDFLEPFAFNSIQGIYMNTIKTSFFDEYQFIDCIKIIGTIILIMATVLFIASIIILVCNIAKAYKKKKNYFFIWICLIIILSYMLSFYKFCYNYPAYFTINFRYIYIIYPVFLVIMALCLDVIKNKQIVNIYFACFMVLFILSTICVFSLTVI